MLELAAECKRLRRLVHFSTAQVSGTRGGVILDTAKLNRTVFLKPGVGRFESGTNLIEVDRQARAIGWEMRMHPSTKRMSSIGGFICGGAAGIGKGSIPSRNPNGELRRGAGRCGRFFDTVIFKGSVV